MSQNFKPKGYNSLSPYFIVDDAKKFIALIVDIFDAEELRKYDMPDGTIMHAEIKIDDSVIMLGNSSEEYPAITQMTHTYVKDLDRIYKKAIDLGCKVIQEPKKSEADPDRRGSFMDFEGNVWSLGTQVEEEK